MVKTGRSRPDSAEVEHNMQIEQEEMERAQTAPDMARTGSKKEVSPSTSMAQTAILTNDLHGGGNDLPESSVTEVAGEDIATVAMETNSKVDDTAELREETRVSGRRGDRPSWEVLMTRDELMKGTELDQHDNKRMNTLDAEIVYDKEGKTVNSDRDGKGSSTKVTSEHTRDLEQLATQHDLECRQNRVATVPDDDSRLPQRPGSPTKSKKLKKEPAMPPPRARSRSNSRYKL
jgi:hypothetical protein